MSFTDFKVADLSLAALGRKQIQLAEQEMPGLMAIRAEYTDAQPLAGRRHRRADAVLGTAVAARAGDAAQHAELLEGGVHRKFD